MDTKAIIKKLLHLLVAGLPDVSTVNAPLRVVFATVVQKRSFCSGCILQSKCGVDSFLAGMHEDHDLVALLNQFRDLLKGNSVQISLRLDTPWFTPDTYEMLF